MKIKFSSSGEIIQTEKMEIKSCDLCGKEILEGQHVVKDWHAGCYCKILEKRRINNVGC